MFHGAYSPLALAVASEKAELLIVPPGYEKEISHLAYLYNNHPALLDQHPLSTDLVEIAKYASSHPSHLTICRTLRKLNNSLPPAHPEFGKRKIPIFEGLWRAGDVREVITAENAAIGGIRSWWQIEVALWGTMPASTTPDATTSLHARIYDGN